MKVTEVYEDGFIRFSNGFSIESSHRTDCCEENYLDFEEVFKVGEEFEDMTFEEFLKRIKLPEDRDGLIISLDKVFKKFVQARSVQNGFYSDTMGVEVHDGRGKTYRMDEDGKFVEYFEGAEIITGIEEEVTEVDYWYISDTGEIKFEKVRSVQGRRNMRDRQDLGNFFETEEEAEKKLEKIKKEGK